jgi:hypothetical protein
MAFARDLTTDDPRPSMATQIRSLAIILREEFGVPFRFYEASTGALLDVPAPEEKEWALAPSPAVEGPMAVRLVADGAPRVQPLAGGRYQLALPFPRPDRPTMIAVGVIGGLARSPSEVAQEQSRIGKWLRAVHDRLRVACQSAGRHRHANDHDGASLVGLEALMGLEQLLRSQRIDKDPDRNRRQILQAAAEVLRARAILWLPPRGDQATIEGEPLLSAWDCGALARLLTQDPGGMKAGYLINNRVQANSWGARFPRVVSLLAVAVTVKGGASWVIALNKKATATPHGHAGQPDPGEGSSGAAEAGPVTVFRRTDAALLLPFAALLGVHLRASRKHQQVKGLLVGLTRSLARAVDARDAFVAGHSERVARIAVELGRELGLNEDELSDLYLGGLLHDVGKIGVSDSILRKRDPLTPEELALVRQHVTIGYNLLAELRPIAHLLPAVLHHHERYDGTGYPDGLKGDTIPFLARILAVAECYDAMTSPGPARPGPAREPVEDVLARGADLQWDGRVIAAFFRCRDRIHAIEERGFGESLRDALDAALHHADNDSHGSSMLAHDPPSPVRPGSEGALCGPSVA